MFGVTRGTDDVKVFDPMQFHCLFQWRIIVVDILSHRLASHFIVLLFLVNVDRIKLSQKMLIDRKESWPRKELEVVFLLV